jgi:hypothetical protein
MDCDPNALASAARCFSCLPDPKAVTIYLLCQWGNASTPCDAEIPVLTAVTLLDPDTGTVEVFWTVSADPGVGFKIYFGQNAGGPYDDPQSPISVAANLRSKVITGLIFNATYSFVVTSVDNLAPLCESAFSNQVQVDIVP